MTLQQQVDHRVRLQPDSQRIWADAAAAWLADAHCAIFCAHRDDRIDGYIVGWVQDTPPGTLPPQQGIVTDLAIDAHRPGSGIGRALWSALRDWFTAQNIQHVIAHVAHRYPVEQAFWRATGARDWVDLLWLKL